MKLRKLLVVSIIALLGCEEGIGESNNETEAFDGLYRKSNEHNAAEIIEQNSASVFGRLETSKISSDSYYDAEVDYTPLAACGCDSFSGRVEMTATTDADKNENSGVLEIGNRLRIDNNEMITNEGVTLYFQHGNNGDLRVDSTTLMVDSSMNRVGVGTIYPESKLDVRGDIKAYDVVADSITAGEIIVDADLADYVFQSGYDLKSLKEVEEFIAENNHLPNMPSETDVNSHGLSLGDFNNLLLQKIEELTLHMIEQNKKIEALERNMASNK